jgi:hypothetical protein
MSYGVVFWSEHILQAKEPEVLIPLFYSGMRMYFLS